MPTESGKGKGYLGSSFRHELLGCVAPDGGHGDDPVDVHVVLYRVTLQPHRLLRVSLQEPAPEVKTAGFINVRNLISGVKGHLTI